MSVNLNKDLIQRANSVSHFDAGNVIQRDADNAHGRFYNTFSGAEYTSEQQEYIDRRSCEWDALVTATYNENLSRRASWVPATVSGPAKYNWKREGAKADKAMARSIEMSEKMDRFIENTKKEIERLTPIEDVLQRLKSGEWKYGEAIASNDPYAIEKLTAKLEYLQDFHATMKLENKANKGAHPAWKLQNNNATIKATKDRIADLTNKAQIETKEIEISEGVTVVENTDIDRLQIMFDGKPDESIRNILKSNGFKWAPSQSAWQRQLTSNAKYALKRILPQLQAI